MRFFLIFILMCFGALCSQVLASSSEKSVEKVFFPHGNHSESLEPYAQYLEDPGGKLTISEVAARKADDFKQLESMHAPGFTRTVFWIKFTADFSNYQEPYWFLRKDFSLVGHIGFYYPAANGFVQQDIEESEQGYSRSIVAPDFLFKIPTIKGFSSTYYLRIEPRNHSANLSFSWASEKAIIEWINISQLLLGLFYGGCVMMFAYNFCLRIATGDLAYSYYIYYLTCFVLVFASQNGLLSLFLPYSHYQSVAFVLALYGMQHGSILYLRRFLDLSTALPQWDKRMLNLTWFLAVGAASSLIIPYMIAIKIALIMIPIAISTALPCLIIRRQQGYEPANIYLAGWGVYLVPAIMFVLVVFGIIPRNNWTAYGVQVGALWEIFMSSLALAYRIKEKKDALDRQKNREMELLEGERKLLEQRVGERTQELEASLEARRIMIANASHELRTPVNTLRLLLELSALSGTERRQIVPQVQTLAEHMCHVVDTLLLVDPEQTLATQEPNRNFDLGAEIRAAIKITDFIRSNSKAEFLVDIHCDGVMVRGKAFALRRIIVNVLSNAFKFTNTGHVSIEAHSVQDGENGVLCTIRISDTGDGIPVGMHDSIFELFVTSGTKNGHTGTGLGLPIARRLAKELGGVLLLAKSVLGEGSVFECTVKMEAVDPPLFSEQFDNSTQQISRSADVSPYRKLRVLLAEDDLVTAEVVQTIIRLLGHNVFHVTNFSDLSNSLISGQYDVAFIDNRMPGGSGVDAIVQYRKIKSQNPIHIVLMTADATPDVLDLAKEVCDEVIIKPTSAEAIRCILGGNFVQNRERLESIQSGLLNSSSFDALISSGVSKEHLAKICLIFCENVEPTLLAIEALVQGLDRLDEESELSAIIHKLQSACSTVGAAALEADLIALKVCNDRVEAMQVYKKSLATFRLTKSVLLESYCNG